MFTGIITHTGKLEKKGREMFAFSAPRDFMKKLKKGASVTVNGCCLTVKSVSQSTFSIDIMPETQKKTMLGSLKIGDIINLELPVSAGSLLSGHIVQGHIDGVGKIAKIQNEENSKILTIGIPKSLNRYIVEKGSIAINGISLTVINVRKNSFTVGIIPHTWEQTMLHTVKVGDKVNIEVDILAKYTEKLIKL